jgi:hypothetical protein
VIVRLDIKTVHRCQVVALAWSRFNPSIRLLIAVKLMDLIVTPLAQSPRHSNSLKRKAGHSGQQSAVFQPDLRSLRHFYRIPSHQFRPTAVRRLMFLLDMISILDGLRPNWLLKGNDELSHWPATP